MFRNDVPNRLWRWSGPVIRASSTDLLTATSVFGMNQSGDIGFRDEITRIGSGVRRVGVYTTNGGTVNEVLSTESLFTGFDSTRAFNDFGDIAVVARYSHIGGAVAKATCGSRSLTK